MLITDYFEIGSAQEAHGPRVDLYLGPQLTNNVCFSLISPAIINRL